LGLVLESSAGCIQTLCQTRPHAFEVFVSKLPPVSCSVVADLEIESAFELFFDRMGEWWPLDTRSVNLANASTCFVEPSVGGRIAEKTRDGQEAMWGTILVWDPPRRAVFTWHPGVPDMVATEVEATFTPLGKQTRVDVEHRHWERLGSLAAEIRGRYEGGWVPVLQRFAERSQGASELSAATGPGCGEQMEAAVAEISSKS